MSIREGKMKKIFILTVITTLTAFMAASMVSAEDNQWKYFNPWKYFFYI